MVVMKELVPEDGNQTLPQQEHLDSIFSFRSTVRPDNTSVSRKCEVSICRAAQNSYVVLKFPYMGILITRLDETQPRLQVL